MGKFHRSVSAEARPGHKVRLTYDDGRTGEVDFSSVIETGGVFHRLKDPRFFRNVQIGEGGRYIEWPEGIDFCADALRKKLPRVAPKSKPTRTR